MGHCYMDTRTKNIQNIQNNFTTFFSHTQLVVRSESKHSTDTEQDREWCIVIVRLWINNHSQFLLSDVVGLFGPTMAGKYLQIHCNTNTNTHCDHISDTPKYQLTGLNRLPTTTPTPHKIYDQDISDRFCEQKAPQYTQFKANSTHPNVGVEITQKNIQKKRKTHSWKCSFCALRRIRITNFRKISAVDEQHQCQVLANIEIFGYRFSIDRNTTTYTLYGSHESISFRLSFFWQFQLFSSPFWTHTHPPKTQISSPLSLYLLLIFHVFVFAQQYHSFNPITYLLVFEWNLMNAPLNVEHIERDRWHVRIVAQFIRMRDPRVAFA